MANAKEKPRGCFVPQSIVGPCEVMRVTAGDELIAVGATQLSAEPTIAVESLARYRLLLPVLRDLQAKVVLLAFTVEDLAGNHQDANALYDVLADEGCDVRAERWDGSKHKTIYDLLSCGKEPEVIFGEAVETWLRKLATAKRPAKELDFATEAEKFLAEWQQDDMPCLRTQNGNCIAYLRGRYVDMPESEVQAKLIAFLAKRYHHLGRNIVASVLAHLKSQSLLPFTFQAPCWLEQPEGLNWLPRDIIATGRSLLHLPTLVADPSVACIPATPRFLTPAALDFDYDQDAAEPIIWKGFLRELWPDDPESIETLQEWMGYCLVADTRQQKILTIIGPQRSGKGTIARVQRSIVGEFNVCGPTLGSLGGEFGLQPWLGKTLAIISDARLSGRTDQAVIVERLLSISGEDQLTVNMKFREAVTTKLLTRIMMLTNELPRFKDASGAIAGRMIVLRLTESFYGREDRTLTDRLMTERPGILLWAIEGWKRLQERGYFRQPERSRSLVDQLRASVSPIRCFVDDRCELDPEKEEPKQSLFDGYRAWAVKAGFRPKDDSTFARDLIAAFPTVETKRTRDGELRRYVYAGIKLLPEVLP